MIVPKCVCWKLVHWPVPWQMWALAECLCTDTETSLVTLDTFWWGWRALRRQATVSTSGDSDCRKNWSYWDTIPSVRAWGRSQHALYKLLLTLGEKIWMQQDFSYLSRICHNMFHIWMTVLLLFFMTFQWEVNVTLILQIVAVKQSNDLPDTSETLMTAMPHVTGEVKWHRSSFILFLCVVC